LPEAQRPDAALLDQAGRDPARLLNADKLVLGRRGDREIALYALDQLARSSTARRRRCVRRRSNQPAARRWASQPLAWFAAGAVALSDFNANGKARQRARRRLRRAACDRAWRRHPGAAGLALLARTRPVGDRPA
jgi:soluble lytic murein transglycosylase